MSCITYFMFPEHLQYTRHSAVGLYRLVPHFRLTITVCAADYDYFHLEIKKLRFGAPKFLGQSRKINQWRNQAANPGGLNSKHFRVALLACSCSRRPGGGHLVHLTDEAQTSSVAVLVST